MVRILKKPSLPKEKKQTKKVPSSEKVKITEEEIRKRAYEIYLRRNKQPSDPKQDWMQAERELRAEME